MSAKNIQALQQLSVTVLKGVGQAVAEKLAKLNIITIQDILFHLPMRYQDRTRVVPIRNLRHGDYALIEGEVVTSQIKFGKKRQLSVTLQDLSGTIQLRFFHFNKSQQQQLEAGTKLQCFGEVQVWNNGRVMVHPEYRLLQDAAPSKVNEHLTPIYPSTEGLHQTMWRKLTEQALLYAREKGVVEDYIPHEILVEQNFMLLADALCYVHRPPPDADQTLLLEGKHPAQRRLAFEELLAQQLSMYQLRQSMRQHQAPTFTVDETQQAAFLKNLAFTLTAAQQKVQQEISHDLQQTRPMLRLVQGDVGSGKTVVAALAALQAISNGYQVAIMAPTEILAEQHYQTFRKWLEPMSLRTAWLTGSLTAKQRRDTLENIALGLDQLIVGTHALFQDDVVFKKLGLVIIDEQHRFGVHQRLALREKGRSGNSYPHQLIMTATPIPRTLAMTAYADLDVSIIDELPPGRTPVNTVVVSQSRREEILERVRELCSSGGQVYWVCPLIEESENLQCQAAEQTEQTLRELLPEINIGLVHGRLRPAEKEHVMQKFTGGETALLVATTVIEVGVNVPNASLMVIENAERLGLAQLHQLRGRVGRGAAHSHCVLLYKAPLSDIAKERLALMRETTDGFKIAEKDLEFRGPGEVLGTRQTGLQQFRVADLLRDRDLLMLARKQMKIIINQYPDAVHKLIHRWVGERKEYANA